MDRENTTLHALMRRHKPLPREEELKIAVRAKKGDPGAIEKLVVHNLRFVAKATAPYARANPTIPFEDLMGYGIEGMMRALPKFDPARGLRFMTYASPWVHSLLDRGVACSELTVREGIGANGSSNYRRIAKGVRRVEIVHLDAPLAENRETSLLDFMESPDMPADDDVDRCRHIAAVRARLDRINLSRLDRDILESRLLAHDPDALQQIADRHTTTRGGIARCVSREWVRLRELALKEKLRKTLADLAA